jgi:hypothetical protein
MLSFTRFATLCAILELISAKSATFTLKLDSSASALSGFEPSVHSGGIRIDLDASGSSMSGYIDDDGQLIVDETVMGIGKNYLALHSTSSSWIIAQPFTIVDGKLKLYGSDFHVVPNGEDSGYVLGSINAAATRSDMIPVAIIPEGADGNAIQSYDATTQSSSEEATSSTSTGTSTTSSSNTTVQSTTSSSTATVQPTTSSSTATVQSTTSSSNATVQSTTSSSNATAQSTTSPSTASSTATVKSTTSSSQTASQSASSSKATSQSVSSLNTVLSISSSKTTTPQVSTFDSGALRTGVSAGMAVALLALL